MFCWICKNDFRINDAFRQAFPSIERFLLYSKRKEMLDQVVSLPFELSLHGSQQLTSAIRLSLPAQTIKLARSSHTSFCTLPMVFASVQCLQMRRIQSLGTLRSGAC